MQSDPFYVVKGDVTQSVTGVVQLFEKWKELFDTTNTATNEEFRWTLNELRDGIKNIEWDLQDLEDTINVVEGNRIKFKLDEKEIESRKAFVATTNRHIQEIKETINSTRSKGKMENDERATLMPSGKHEKFVKLEQAIVQDNSEFIQDQENQQQVIMKKQDQNLDQLSNTVGTLKDISNTIGVELKEHEDLLGELGTKVDHVDSGLKGIIKRVDTLIEKSKDGTQWAIVIILVLVLIGLVVLVFFV